MIDFEITDYTKFEIQNCYQNELFMQNMFVIVKKDWKLKIIFFYINYWIGLKNYKET